MEYGSLCVMMPPFMRDGAISLIVRDSAFLVRDGAFLFMRDGTLLRAQRRLLVHDGAFLFVRNGALLRA